jgi:hypothetical protein
VGFPGQRLVTCLPFLFEPVAEHLETTLGSWLDTRDTQLTSRASLMSLTRDVSVARLAWHVRLACVASDVCHMFNTSRALEVLHALKRQRRAT